MDHLRQQAVEFGGTESGGFGSEESVSRELHQYRPRHPQKSLFYEDLWRHRPHPRPRKVNTYFKGRRREVAILIQHMVRWRLTRRDAQAPRGKTMTGVDASNAFMSVHHTTLDKLVTTSFEDEKDRALMRQRYSALLWLPTEEAPLVLLFNDVYSEQIAKWERQCEKTNTDAEYLRAIPTTHHPPSLPTTSRSGQSQKLHRR